MRRVILTNYQETKRVVPLPLRWCVVALVFLGSAVGGVAADSNEFTGRIRGRVVDSGRDPLIGVNVVIEGTYLGNVTDDEGKFEIQNIPPGTYVVVASMVGYGSAKVPNVRVTEHEIVEIELTLTETIIELGEIQVTARTADQAPDDPRTSLRSIEPELSKSLPGFGEDVLRSLQVLPGVVAPSDFSAQLVIRGSGPDQNLIIMDDIEIYNPYRLYGLISMFNPEMVSDISLITGGFPARYGDRLSAVLDVSNREGARDVAVGGSVNASITNANIVLDGRTPFGIPGSYIISGRRTYYDLIVGPIAKRAGLVANDVAFPNFADLQGKLAIGPAGGHKVTINGLLSRDGVDIVSGSNRPTPDSVNAFNETNHKVAGLSWQYLPSDRFISKSSVSYYQNDGYTEFGGSFLDPVLNRSEFTGDDADTTGIRLFTIEARSKYVFEKYSFKQDITTKFTNHIIETGVGADYLRSLLRWNVVLDPTLKAILGNRGVSVLDQLDQRSHYWRFNAYIQDKIQLSPDFIFQPSFRFDYYELLNKLYVAPRIYLTYRIDEVTTLRTGAGVYYQSPGYEKLVDQRRNSFVELTGQALGSLSAERSMHAVVGIDRWIDEDVQVKADAYYKRFDNLIVPRIVEGTRYQTTLLPGGNPMDPADWTTPVRATGDSTTSIPFNGSDGDAFGIEFLLEKKRRTRETRLYGWISYALAWTGRQAHGHSYPFDFDQRHTVNIVANYRILGWLDLGITWRYGSNFPYTPAQGVYPRIVTRTVSGQDQPVIETDINGNVIFDIDRGDFSDVNTGRKPAYHRLDLRLTAYAEFWSLDWSFYLDIINVYNRSNVLNYDYHVEQDGSLGVRTTTMFPILPTLGMSFRF